MTAPSTTGVDTSLLSGQIPKRYRKKVSSTPPIGSMVAASMKNVPQDQALSGSRSVEKLVLTVVERSMRLAGLSVKTDDPVTVIIRSLALPFVARRSLSKEEWFTHKELGRFTASLAVTAINVASYVSEDNREQKFCKYWLDSYLGAAFMDPVRPIRPDWLQKPLFSGWCRKAVARAHAKRDIAFIYSLQKGSKQSWSTLSQMSKMIALETHRIRMENADKTPIPRDMVEVLQQVSKEIFRVPPPFLTRFMPSPKACLQASFRKGGALSFTQRLDMDLSSLNGDMARIGKLRYLNNKVNEWRTTEFASALRDSLVNFIPRVVTKTVVFDKKKIKVVIPDCREALLVKIVPVKDLAKWRIISEGCGRTYTALQPLQGALLGCWKNCPYSTMHADDATTTIRTLDSDWESFLKDNKLDSSLFPLTSGDYEAATDLLKSESTRLAFGEVVSWPFGWLGWASLQAGTAIYPDGKVANVLEGQLMGHPLSFPLLCVINLSVYRCAIRRWVTHNGKYNEKEIYRTKQFSLFDDKDLDGLTFRMRVRIGQFMHTRVIINGDDIFFRAARSFSSYFEKAASDVGLKLSVGKNYVSPDVCMINSQIFRRVAGKMHRFGYLNQTIVYGKLNSKAQPTQIGNDVNAMVDLCPWTRCTIPLCFRRWGNDWFGPIYRPNWYLPVHLGGFGVKREFAPLGWKPTLGQRLIAARFIADPRMALYRREGISIKTAELSGAIAKWRMVPGSYVPQEFEVTTSSDEWLSRLAYATMAQEGSKEYSDEVFIKKFYNNVPLKPISLARLEDYWSAQMFTSLLPVCPPIGHIMPELGGALLGLTMFLDERKVRALTTFHDVPTGSRSSDYGVSDPALVRNYVNDVYKETIRSLKETYPITFGLHRTFPVQIIGRVTELPEVGFVSR